MQNNPRVTNDIKKPIVLSGCMVLSVLAYCKYFKELQKYSPFPESLHFYIYPSSTIFLLTLT